MKYTWMTSRVLLPRPSRCWPRFIIADLTDPSSIPKELEAIVPGYRHAPPRRSIGSRTSELTYKYFRLLIPNLYIPNIATIDFFTRGG